MAISPAGDTDRHWVRQYARDHAIHALVVLLLIAYPGVHWMVNHEAQGMTLGKFLLPELTTMSVIIYFGLFAMSFDFISGYTGYLSFGHSLFFGTGAFFVLFARNGAIPFVAWDTPFMQLLIMAMVLAFVFGVLKGLVSFRLTGVYFAMITLGFAELATAFMDSIVGDSGIQPTPPASAESGAQVTYEIGVPFVDALQFPVGNFLFTMGPALHDVPGLAQLMDLLAAVPGLLTLPGIDAVVDALSGVPILGILVSFLDSIPGLGGPILPTDEIVLNTVTTNMLLLGAVALVVYFVMQRVLHSPVGRVMIAIRENEDRARAIGYNTYWYKVGTFAFSGAMGAVGGALFAAYNNNATAGNALSVLQVSGDALITTIIGGMGTLVGPFYGVVFFEELTEMFGAEKAQLVKFLETSFSEFLNSPAVFEITYKGYLEWFVQGRESLWLGLVFILFVLFVPGGLLGTVRSAMGGPVTKTFPRWVRRRLPGLSRFRR